MLYLFHGSDVTGARREALKMVHEQSGESSEVRTIIPEDFSESLLKDAVGATSLFRTHEVVVIDTLSDVPEAYAVLLDFLPELAESENIFCVIETKLNAKDRTLFEKHAKKVTDCVAKATKEYNPFALSDALRERDKKTLWILLQEAWQRGASNEEIIGTLFWQLKMLRLTERTKSADEAGQKPFVYDKAKRALKKFKEGELEKISHDLLMLYHEGHSGKGDIALSLEHWVLKL
jgi:DNA polymerase III delta subunit